MLRSRIILTLLCAAVASAYADVPRPNILLLMAEDMGPRVGAFGDALASTPTLDQLAAEGVRYTNTFTTAGVCAPSRAALITGVHQNTLGAGHMRTQSSHWPLQYLAVPAEEVKAFPELLRRAGYYTFTDIKLDYQFSGPSYGTGPATIIIWTTDHGDGLPRFKREVFDTGIHVPLIVRWPSGLAPAKVSAGSVDERLVSFVDLAPTIPRMAGVTAPEFVQGQSFLTSQRTYVYAARDRMDSVPDRQRAVRDQRFKYVRTHREQKPGYMDLTFRNQMRLMRVWRAAFTAGMLNAGACAHAPGAGGLAGRHARSWRPIRSGDGGSLLAR